MHPELKPSLALLDPELTVGLPANLTALTEADALVHAIEAMLDEIAISKSLSEIGVPVDCAGRITGKALKDSAARTNTRVKKLAEIQALTQPAIVKAR